MLLSTQHPAVTREALPELPITFVDKYSRGPDPLRQRSVRILNGLCFLVLFWCFFGCHTVSYALDLDTAIVGFERRYRAIETVKGNFRQHYRAPAQGIEQTESGVFWFKRPGLMRWECRQPEEKLFVVDGHQSFHYVPLDYQVYIQPFTKEDLRSTPLELLLGTVDIDKSYTYSWEVSILPNYEHTCMIRLEPRKPEPGYSFLVLELDQETWDLRRLILRETTGNTSEFLFTNVETNIKIEDSKFRFKIPKGVDVVQLDDDQ
jgi:outer membrane lipoprotein carrier protein